MVIPSGARILFQGDSITDTGRDRRVLAANRADGMGNGYAYLVMCRLLADRPRDGLCFFNRGISGDKAIDLLDRWKPDCLALRPDVVSILVGVNDIWHQLEKRGGRTAEQYEQDLGELLARTRAALPDAALIVCEPFALRTGAVDARWFPEFDFRRAATRRLSAAVGGVFVSFQSVFDAAVQSGIPPEHWAEDGVHPTPQGHQLMADAWLAALP